MGPIEAFVKLYNRTSAKDLAARVYGPDADEDYLEEKSWVCARDPIRWMSSLDGENMVRLEQLVADFQQGKAL